MLIQLRKKTGQGTAEYAILIALVVAAAMAIQTYVKRGLQAGIKYTVDKSTKTAGTQQYEPYYLQSNYTTTRAASTTTEEVKAIGDIERTSASGITARSGTQVTRNTTGAN